jgi:hypothetical protein
MPAMTSPRPRVELNRLELQAIQHVLRSDQRRCRTSTLERLCRRGWLSGQSDGYRFTRAGWALAERCESLTATRDMTVVA